VDIAMRLERLRDHLVTLGERPRLSNPEDRESHADFSDFSESSGSEERDPTPTNLTDQA